MCGWMKGCARVVSMVTCIDKHVRLILSPRAWRTLKSSEVECIQSRSLQMGWHLDRSGVPQCPHAGPQQHCTVAFVSSCTQDRDCICTEIKQGSERTTQKYLVWADNLRWYTLAALFLPRRVRFVRVSVTVIPSLRVNI